MALAIVIAGCGDDNGTDTNATEAPGSTMAGSETAPPVSLKGRVNDHGSKDLAGDTEFDLELDDSYFAPTFVTAQPGATVTVKLENEGDTAHTFTIDGTDVDEEVRPGQSATVEVSLPEDGTLVYYCRFHVAAGMQGAFVVGAGTGAGSTNGGGSTNGAATTSSAGNQGGYGY